MKIEDIAKIAEVSTSAVSLALNGKKGVSEKTRTKILKIARENGYISKSSNKKEASNIDTRILRFIACTNAGIVNQQYQALPFFMELMKNIDKYTITSGYSLTVSSVDITNLREEIIKIEQEQKSAGILLLGTNLTADQIKIFAEIQPNLVVLDTCYDTLNVNFVLMNNIFGAYQAGKHLYELGHKNIGYVASDVRMYNFDMRKKGFLQAISEQGLKISENNFYTISPTEVTSQESFKEKILKNLEHLPTAFFCECDYMAISVIKSLQELGLKVPEQVSVIGFDNILESQVITPELDTINVKKDKIALFAVEKLVKQIENNESEKIKLFIDTELIKRKSCAPA
ncbi:LacI family DNA-binding transcriptional regulator [Cytobacillus sp. Hz8]|uniref:LacI family DNA-binding transcriptional regulator n=1 Tax=Cytobacillus sp. Hz8 TaxID=3347168 RepID=UPI0035D92E1D